MFQWDLWNSLDLCNHWVFVAFLNQIAPAAFFAFGYLTARLRRTPSLSPT